MNKDRKIRVLIAKIGCDIHERGALTLLHTFRDAGMEAIYTGRYQTPEAVVTAAIDEDVDLIALSDHTGSLPIIASSVLVELKRRKADDIPVMAGGLLSPRDVQEIERWHDDRFGADLRLVRVEDIRTSGNVVTVDAVATSKIAKAWKVNSVAGRVTFVVEEGKIVESKFRLRSNIPLEGW